MEETSAATNNDGVADHISDVPDHILMEIFSKLSVKSIRRCMSVCKHLFRVLTNPDFIQLHFDRAPVCPLLCHNYGKPTTLRGGTFCGTLERKERSSRSLSLFEFERDSIVNANDSSDNNLNLTVFKLPRLQSRSQVGTSECRGYTIVNSCNGFLCLQGKMNNFSVAIYNPVTGEYSILPIPGDVDNVGMPKKVFVYGLGFCPNTNQYKVLLLKNVESYDCCDCGNRPVCWTKVALIYTLGLEGGGWREVESPPCFRCCSVLNPIFFNGSLHWLAETYKTCDKVIFHIIGVKCLVSFSFEREKFQIFPAPPGFGLNGSEENVQGHCLRAVLNPVKSDTILGIVRGHLYLCDRLMNSNITDIWVMKEYGVEKSWTKEYVIDITEGEIWSLGLSPISNFSKDWDLLFYSPQNKSIYFIDEHQSIRCLTIGETKSDFEVFAHVPSFLSIKNIVENTLEVLNVNRRNHA